MKLFDVPHSPDENVTDIDQLFVATLQDGATHFGVTEEIQDEVAKVARKIGDSEEDLPADRFKKVAPGIFTEWIDPIHDLLGDGDFHPTFGKLRLPADTLGSSLKLHADSNILYGMTILVPISGPEARMFHGDTPLEFTEVSITDSFLYGVGRAAMLRQRTRVSSSDGSVVDYPQRYHGGFCVSGDREVLAIDLHTAGSIIALTAHP